MRHYQFITYVEYECTIVERNRELIRVYKEKVKRVIEKVWEG